MAEDMDSPFVVTRTESAGPGIINSRDVGREASFLQGPGESPVINGDGRGVTSAIALNIGDESAEFGADPPIFDADPRLLASACLILGVLLGIFVGICNAFEGGFWSSPDLPADGALLSAGAVTEHEGLISVHNRGRPALKGV
jgi:hypothetical protein